MDYLKVATHVNTTITQSTIFRSKTQTYEPSVDNILQWRCICAVVFVSEIKRLVYTIEVSVITVGILHGRNLSFERFVRNV